MAITNFMNLADIYREADRGRTAQRQEDTYQRGRQQEQTLADIFSQQRGMDPSTLDQGAEYVAGTPEINTGTGGDGSYSVPPTGEYSPAVSEQSARPPNHALNAIKKLEHAALTKRETSRKLGERGFGSLAAKVAAEADSIDEKIINSKFLISNKSGMDLKHPGLIEDEKGNLYNQYISSDGSTVIKNAVGEVVDPRTIKNPRITKGNAYINVSGPDGTPIVQAAPRAGGAQPSYNAPVVKEVNDLADTVHKRGIPNMEAPFRKLNTIFEKYGTDAAGLGYLKNTPIESYIGSTEGKHVKSLVQTIYNTRLFNVSGQAVTVPEEVRQRVATSLTPGHSAEDFIKTFNEVLLPWYENEKRNIVGGVSPHALKIYEKNSGISLDPSKNPVGSVPTEFGKDAPRNNKLPPKDQLKSDGKTRYLVNGKMMLWNGRGFVE